MALAKYGTCSSKKMYSSLNSSLLEDWALQRLRLRSIGRGMKFALTAIPKHLRLMQKRVGLLVSQSTLPRSPMRGFSGCLDSCQQCQNQARVSARSGIVTSSYDGGGFTF